MLGIYLGISTALKNAACIKLVYLSVIKMSIA